jgi:tetratricopeptide (TPR) repeat protein
LVHIFHQVGGWATGLILIILLFSSSGCSLWRTDKFSLPADLPEEILLDEVPFFQQETYQCGPSSLAMVLAWTGLELTPDDLIADVYSASLHGSLQPSLISAARQYGRVAYPIKGLKELFAEVNAEHPVIVLQNLGLNWYPKWHYAVVIGHENGGRTIILHSGAKAAERLSIQVFQSTWSRSDYWGLLVLPTDELPALVTEGKYLNAVAGLERTRQFEAAISAYKTAITRWPQSLSAWMGLGNSFYAQGDLLSAANAFNQAMQLYPSNGMPMNNLAQVFWEQGKKEQAIQVIRHAIELGGPFKYVFEETLHNFEQNEE